MMAKLENFSIDNKFVKIWIDDNIAYMNYTPGLQMDLEVAKQIVKLRLEFFKGNFFPLIVFVDKINSISKEAREYMAKEGTEYLSANAIIVDSLVSKIMGNFYIKLSKPIVPTSLFTDVTEAKKWISPYMEK